MIEPTREDVEKKIRERLISGKVTIQKKTVGDKFKDTFITDELKDVGNSIIHDIVITSIKSIAFDTVSTIFETVTDAISYGLFGEKSIKESKRNGSYINYGKYSSKDRNTRTPVQKTSHNFDTVSFASKDEAEVILDHLLELVYETGQASVGDFYDACGVDSDFVDDRYGWTNLGSSSVVRVRNGYIIKLPKTKLLD